MICFIGCGPNENEIMQLELAEAKSDGDPVAIRKFYKDDITTVVLKSSER